MMQTIKISLQNIQKHSLFTLFLKLKTEKSEKEASPSFQNITASSLPSDSSGRSSPSTNSPKKTLVAKRIIDRLISDSDCKSTASTVTTSNNHHTSSTLSADLLTRLSFNNNASSTSNGTTAQVVRFNKDSLISESVAKAQPLNSKVVVVSSTTSDDPYEDNDSLTRTGSKIISLKRKSTGSDTTSSNRALEYMGTLKTEPSTAKNRTLSLNDRLKIVSSNTGSGSSSFSKFSGLTVTTSTGVDSAASNSTTIKSKVVKLAMDDVAEQQHHKATNKLNSKSSVFNRIKKVNNQPQQRIGSTAVGARADEKPAMTSKIISLNKSKPQQSETNSNKKLKSSIHDRLSFK
jgi:hypothetical protein